MQSSLQQTPLGNTSFRTHREYSITGSVSAKSFVPFAIGAAAIRGVRSDIDLIPTLAFRPEACLIEPAIVDRSYRFVAVIHHSGIDIAPPDALPPKASPGEHWLIPHPEPSACSRALRAFGFCKAGDRNKAAPFWLTRQADLHRFSEVGDIVDRLRFGIGLHAFQAQWKAPNHCLKNALAARFAHFHSGPTG